MEECNSKSHYLFDRKNLNFFKKWWIDIDKVNFLLIISIITFGLIMTTTSSPDVAKKIDTYKLFFVKKQVIFSVCALFILVIFSFFNRNQIKIISILGMAAVLFLLTIVFLFGYEAKGARRWIAIFGFTIQPSEFAKTFFLVFNALILQKMYNKEWYIKYGVSFFFYITIIFLLILQPDFGMTLVFTILWLTQLFLIGLSIPLMCFIAFLGIMGAIYAYLTLPHVEDRINKFLNIDNVNYQVERSIDAYVNGGLLGTGPGNGLVKKYIPDAHTDFVFAVVGEEFGLIFCIFIVFIILTIVTRVVKRSFIENDLFSYLAVVGIITQFALQTLINIGVSLGALPTKGMTLPFISYGGSSIIAMSIAFGIVLSLTKKKYDNKVNHNNIALI